MSTRSRYAQTSQLANALCGPKEHHSHDFDRTGLSRDERIASVGPIIIKIAYRFWSDLSPREQANFDIEDLMLEIWIELAVKDEKYDARRAQYTTFAARVAESRLRTLRRKTRTVELPRYSERKLTDPRQTSALTLARYNAVAVKGVSGLNNKRAEAKLATTKDETLAAEEHRQEARNLRIVDAAVKAMARTHPKHAEVIAKNRRIGGVSEAQSPKQIARSLGVSISMVAKLRKEAEAMLAVGFAMLREQSADYPASAMA